MINKDIIKSIFSNYSIDKIIFINEEEFCSFIICSMNDNLSLERWENLENILKDYVNKEVSLLPLVQACNQLGKDYLKKGVIIQWTI